MRASLSRADQSLRKFAFVGLISLALLLSCESLPFLSKPAGKPGEIQDEARLVNRAAASFPAADEDYFAEMDGGAKLSPEEVKGRNTWIVWTGGNDRFWDELSKLSYGTLDFLKTLSSHPSLKFSRDNRWHYSASSMSRVLKRRPAQTEPFRTLARQAHFQS